MFAHGKHKKTQNKKKNTKQKRLWRCRPGHGGFFLGRAEPQALQGLRGTAAPAALVLRELRGAHRGVGPLEGPRRVAVGCALQ